MSSLPLNQIDVVQPCSADWNDMVGTDQARFCTHCQKHVHNLSAMTRHEAEQFVCQAAGRLCIQFERDARGEIRTLEYQKTVGWRGWSWRLWSVVGLAGALVSGTAHALFFGRQMAVTPAPAVPPAVMLVKGEMMPVPCNAPTAGASAIGQAPPDQRH
jgi:hypothetical protein